MRSYIYIYIYTHTDLLQHRPEFDFCRLSHPWFVAVRVQGAGWRALGVVCRVLVTGCRVWVVGKEHVVQGQEHVVRSNLFSGCSAGAAAVHEENEQERMAKLWGKLFEGLGGRWGMAASWRSISAVSEEGGGRRDSSGLAFRAYGRDVTLIAECTEWGGRDQQGGGGKEGAMRAAFMGRQSISF